MTNLVSGELILTLSNKVLLNTTVSVPADLNIDIPFPINIVGFEDELIGKGKWEMTLIFGGFITYMACLND